MTRNVLLQSFIFTPTRASRHSHNESKVVCSRLRRNPAIDRTYEFYAKWVSSELCIKNLLLTFFCAKHLKTSRTYIWRPIGESNTVLLSPRNCFYEFLRIRYKGNAIPSSGRRSGRRRRTCRSSNTASRTNTGLSCRRRRQRLQRRLRARRIFAPKSHIHKFLMRACCVRRR